MLSLLTYAVARGHQTTVPDMLTCELDGNDAGCCSVLRSSTWT
jgi:hypothetical protein